MVAPMRISMDSEMHSCALRAALIPINVCTYMGGSLDANMNVITANKI